MIKIVASDLDGTLLQNGSQSLTPEALELVRKLIDAGIVFVAASGRQYGNLRRLFEPVKDEIAYIAENGALVIYKGVVLSKTVMDREIGEEILVDIRNREGCEILLSGMNTSYIESKAKKYVDHLKYVMKNNVTEVKDILEVTEEYLKISLCDELGEENSEDFFRERWGDKVTVVTAGNGWLDMISQSANKGNAMKVLLANLGLKKEELMAFGDNQNDIEMLKLAEYSYAMENAKEEVKQVSKHITSSVEGTLKQFLSEYC